MQTCYDLVWLSAQRAPGDLAVLFLHLGFAARNGGLEALASAAQVVELPLLKAGLEQVIAARDHAELRADLMAQMEAEISRLERHHFAASAGLLAVVAGAHPDVVTKTAKYGVRDYVSKPATPARIRDKVNKYLG